MSMQNPDNASLDGPKSSQFFWLIVITYITFQLISDVTAAKVVNIGGATVSVSVFYFPFTYIISDILTEVYGFERARRALWSVMAASVTAGLIYQFAIWLPPAEGFPNNEAYRTVLGQVPRVLLFGWIAVFVGDIANNFIMSRLKVIMRGRHLWVRTIGSTIVGQGLNTAVFYVGALGGLLPTDVLFEAILWGWAAKVAVEVAFTPFTYAIIGWVKRREQVDVYDYQANYNPMKF